MQYGESGIPQCPSRKGLLQALSSSPSPVLQMRKQRPGRGGGGDFPRGTSRKVAGLGLEPSNQSSHASASCEHSTGRQLCEDLPGIGGGHSRVRWGP